MQWETLNEEAEEMEDYETSAAPNFIEIKERADGQVHYFFEDASGLDWYYFPETADLMEYNNQRSNSYDVHNTNSILYKIGSFEVRFHKGDCTFEGYEHGYHGSEYKSHRIPMEKILIVFIRAQMGNIDKIELHTEHEHFRISKNYISVDEYPRTPRLPMLNFKECEGVEGYFHTRMNLKKDKKEYIVGGKIMPFHKVLINKLDKIEPGRYIKVVSLGQKDGRHYKYWNYSVLIAKDEEPKHSQKVLFNFGSD